MGRLPFEGIRIADFGWIFAIPHATAWLGALGADVIKVETSGAPDIVRFLSGTDGTPGINRSGMFNSINFSKRSLALNLADPRGGEIARRLVAISDIATENFTVGNMRKFGLTYADLRRVKPDLIMLSGTPLGQTGPYANTVGWGPTTQAFAGLCHLTGYPGEFPCGIGGTWPDFAVGVAMLFVMLAALHHRDRTGEGQYIDLAMAELVTSMIPEAMLDYFMNGRERGPSGNRDPELAPHGVYPTAGHDRWIALAISNDEEFAALCEVLGVPRMAADVRYARMEDRLRNVALLDAEIASLTRDHERDRLVARLREREIAAGPVYNALELLADPAFKASGMLVELDHEVSGPRVVPGLPVTFSALTPAYRAAPAIGRDSDDVLRGLLGYSGAEIEQMREQRIIF